MEFTGVGGGVMVAIAAALWLVYLVPNWFKRREYLATERNAVRLQQTIRVMAESAEVPDEVRAEAAARRLAQQQRAEYRQGPVAVGRAPQRVAVTVDARTASRRLRRTRALGTLVLLASAVLLATQIGVVATVTVVEAGTWLLIGASLISGVSALAMLGRAAEVSRARRAPVAPAVRRTSLGSARPSAPVQQRRPQQAWTPVPVPKPLYLSRPTIEAAAAQQDPEFELQLAAIAAERALRAREQEAPSIQPAAAPAAASNSRFASMGIVDASGAAPDLDAVLARRRAAS